ncbi:MAG TPA: MBL fold metallo-hydrolase [Spongiibacteraceae bacterium]|nr:MBL fold metallo-hydrolase [Spongiibacteraceae bacterium]
MSKIAIEAFFHEPTFTISYVVADCASKRCAIIDPVLDYDASIGRASTEFTDRMIAFVRANEYTLDWILETHAHADHLSSAIYLQQQLGGKIAIGEHITEVQTVFGKLFNLGPDFKRDGSDFDYLVRDGETIALGDSQIQVLHTPGHTLACVTYVIGDAVFVGDTLFMPDYGTARCDFPGGDARQLYHSIRRILALPESTRMFLCHDYLPEGRSEYHWETTVAAQRRDNIHIHDGVGEEAFVALRNARDAQLAKPKLLLPSVQVNIRGGHMPAPESNGISYLKIPLNVL